MAKIKKIQRTVDGVLTTEYPVTIHQAVVDVETDETLDVTLTNIKNDITTKANDVGLFKDESNLKDAIQDSKIKDIESTISTMNPNQSAQLSVSGRKTISLPKNASNGGMEVKMEGLTAENLAVNGDFRNGLTGWIEQELSASISEGVVTLSNFTTSSPRFHKGGTTINEGKYFMKARVRSVGDVAPSRISLGYFISSSTNIATIASPNKGEWYNIVGVGDIPSGTGRLLQIVIASPNIDEGEVVEIDGNIGISAINLTETFGAGNEPTVEECDVIFSDYFEGVKSFEPTGRVRSVGKNLFDKSRNNYLSGSAIDYTIEYVDGRETLLLKGYQNTPDSIIKISEGIIRTGVKYTVTASMKPIDSHAYVGIFYSDGTRTQSLTTDKTKFTELSASNDITKNIDYIIIGSGSVNWDAYVDVNSIQIERNTTKTSYEPYKETNLYLTAPELRNNGLVKDEIRKGANGYELVKRISDTIILNGSENWGVGSTLLTDTISFRLVVGGTKDRGVNRSSFWANRISGISGIDAEIMIGLYGDIFIRINKSRLSTLDVAGFKSWLTANNQRLNYELDEPVITPISYGGVLNSAENGTVYHEQVIADAGVYDTKMDILLTDYPIDAIEEIIKHEDGIDTYLNVDTAVIASDGLSFTHPDLADGDLVLFTYAFDKDSTNGNITASFYDSNVVKIDTATGKAYKIEEVVTNGVLTRTLTEV